MGLYFSFPPPPYDPLLMYEICDHYEGTNLQFVFFLCTNNTPSSKTNPRPPQLLPSPFWRFLAVYIEYSSEKWLK